jgi:hypothetical protein
LKPFPPPSASTGRSTTNVNDPAEPTAVTCPATVRVSTENIAETVEQRRCRSLVVERDRPVALRRRAEQALGEPHSALFEDEVPDAFNDFA